MTDTDDFIDQRHWLPPGHNGKPRVLTAARKARGDVVTVETDRGGSERRSLSRPLEFYVARGHITGAQYRAGLRLNALFERTAQSPFVQVQYRDQEGGEKATSFVPAGFGAVEYRAALAAIASKDAEKVAVLVCCADMPASGSVEASSIRSAKRRGMAHLRQALDDLARHFEAVNAAKRRSHDEGGENTI